MKIKLQNVRLSFPSLFRHSVFGGQSTEKYEATFILDKTEHAGVIKQIEEAQKALMVEKKLKVSSDKLALKDGDDSGRDEMIGKMTIKASTKKRPVLIDRDKTPLVEDDGKPYAGCYVNAIISLWAQDNSYGKRINASLEGVQFYKDGEPFGAGGVSVDEFDDFEDEDAPF
jgi:hypothetical protein